MKTVPNAERIHITLFGIRNAGKSSLVNSIAGRTVSIVSGTPGTTTDPVSIPMELGDLGPVLLTDTAGLDDEGDLGTMRVKRSLERLSTTDVALFVTPLDREPSEQERKALEGILRPGRVALIVGTFSDREVNPEKRAWLDSLSHAGLGRSPAVAFEASGFTGEGVPALRAALAGLRDRGSDSGIIALGESTPLEGLVGRGDLVVLVTPIDSAAPKGRLILPQAETLRDALDRGCHTLVVRETELREALENLSRSPDLVVTDSQAFGTVSADIPANVRLTSFSLLFARKKGELRRFAPGLARLGEIAASGGGYRTVRLLAIEACTHNRTHEDIATVKIPALLSERTGCEVYLTVARELKDVPQGSSFDLAVLCGGCMATRSNMLAQLSSLDSSGVPFLNFGMFLAWAHGVFPRAMEPFALTNVGG